MLAQAKTKGAVKLGNVIILVGLAVQIYIFCFFVKIAASFHRDLLKQPGLIRQCKEFAWKRYFVLLYVACACVGVRNTYRVVEYAMGKVSPLESIQSQRRKNC